jgi:subtilisin family serine protease
MRSRLGLSATLATAIASFVAAGVVSGSSSVRASNMAGALAGTADGELPYVVRFRAPDLLATARAARTAAALAEQAGVSRAERLEIEHENRLLVARVRAANKTLLDEKGALLSQLGARLVDDLEAVAVGFIVRATPEVAATIARRADVAMVTRAPLLAPATLPDEENGTLRNEVTPHVRAPAVWQDLGLDGEDVLVAVLDTGIDYTHRDFGGPGTLEAYAQNSEDLVESGTFPTAKVVGGYDLAGRQYSPHPSCIEPNPPSQRCHRDPRPDNDPLDSRGHGTHVAGIVAGQGSGVVGQGIAPGARLVSLKIFGNPLDAPVVTDLMPSAFDWVFLNNLEEDLPGWPTDPIQVIDMGLTSAWLGGTEETRLLIQRANEEGLTVVVAGGNEGERPFVMGPLAGAETALTVGATWPMGQVGLEYRATWRTEGGTDDAAVGLALDTRIVGQVTTASHPMDGDLAFMGQACADEPVQQPPAGKIALVERGTCAFSDKMAAAQAAGATGVVVFTTPNLAVQEMGGTGQFSIPGAMIDHDTGLALAAAALAGGPARISVSLPEDIDVLGGTMAAFSTRGPTRFEPGIKPQLVAPGLRVMSTAVGAGEGMIAESGSSVSASVAAGAAALIWERNLKARQGLSAADVAALLINYANDDVRDGHSVAGPQSGIGRRGSGFLDARAAAGASTLVRTRRGLAELDLGLLHVTGSTALVSETLEVTNLGASERTYALAPRLRDPSEDAGKGVEVTVEPARLTVPAGESRSARVSVRVVPAALRPWTLYGVEAATRPDLVQEMEVDGWIDVIEQDGSGPRPDGDHARVPFSNLSARHSCVTSTTNGRMEFGAAGSAVAQRFENTCPTPGWVELYALVAEDPAEPWMPEALDIVNVGYRRYLENAEDPESDVIMEWAVQTRGARRTPAAAQFRIYIDQEADGVWDNVVYNLNGGEISRFVPETFDTGRWVNAQGPVTPDSLEPDNFNIATWRYQPYQLDETTTVLIASADEMGLDLRTGDATFAFAVSAVDRNGDHALVAPFAGYDYAPDGLAVAAGEAFTYEQRSHDCFAFQPRVDVPAAGSMATSIEMYCTDPNREAEAGLLFYYPSNAPGPTAAGIRRAGFTASQLEAVFLPRAERR